MTHPYIHIREVIFPEDREALLSIIDEYVVWLDMDLSYRGFADEMATFEEKFTLPSGMFFMAEVDGLVAGCAGILGHSPTEAEMKRLFVRPAFRRQNMGERLVNSVIGKAKSLGYAKLILDAVPQTKIAMKLYERMGFHETSPFYSNPVIGTRFFERVL
jgi:putative acetyltransferase